MAKATRATAALEKAGAAFTVHSYDYDPDADRIGMQAAEALGELPARVLKTLMLLLDGKPACAILPSDAQVAMKKFAAALGGKSAEMMKPADAERITGSRSAGSAPSGRCAKCRPRSRRRRSMSLMSSSTAASAVCRCGSTRTKRHASWLRR